ncbi:DUF4430 domain-containing protein [Lysinibacillus pakistanensis]|uniref:DUF4430 domain-containing protein n=1 Tax=Lysinibacillus pakistanensis TaxID=759811 RepID=A0AAX3WQK6_9BACI|nr:DUF4430 domain-containing protein [Lysinibacillus pakistanensis]MDM5234537.1 DUF4430 domain-containing protein [Lysinibacillus pakistanensis]WHY45114.1 DUF4430 domain-containing protein [Lysinibacillus pakistanensis]WHY50123.1 DUF4430 domain-containing protein [Lysinibacillus pakistanensis]
MVRFKKWWHLALVLLLAFSLVTPSASAAVLQPVSQEAQSADFDVQLSVKGLCGTGSCHEILEGTTVNVQEGTTALELVEQVLDAEGIPYVVVSTQYGPYLQSIDGLAAGSLNGWDGWVYTVNGYSPNFGLAEYQLQADDVVHIYYTTWSKLETASVIAVNDNNPSVTVNLTGDLFTTPNGSNLANWTINTGTTTLTAQSVTMNANQQAVITFAGQAQAGTITITASANALFGSSASEPLEVKVQ